MRSALWRQIVCRRCTRLNVSCTLLQAKHIRQQDVFLSVPHRTFRSLNNNLNSDPSFLSAELDVGLAIPAQSQDEILERAKVHGIDSFERLDFEADLGPVRQLGKRLLDDESVRQDLDLWAVVLDYRRAKDGPRGVRHILDVLVHGGKPVHLYSDAVSNHIWRTLLSVAFEDEKLLHDLCRYGTSLMSNRPSVFTEVVGELLANGNLRFAITYSTQHLISHFRGHPDLINLFDIAFQLGSDTGMHNFCQIVSRLPRYQIYSDVIPRLWEAGRKQQAFVLHKQLLTLGDYPTKFEHIEPFIRELAAQQIEPDVFLQELCSYGISFSHQARRLYKQETWRSQGREGRSVNQNFNPATTTRPAKLSDSFIARTFATRGVSFDFVLNTLSFVGLYEIGPLAVRELAMAAQDVHELRTRFQKLDEMGVDLGASRYVRVIRQLWMSGTDDGLRTILESDMHHEVFEDEQLQKKLLADHYHDFQWRKANQTLSILNSGEMTMEAKRRSAQQVLQASLLAGDWRGALVILDDIRNSNRGFASFSELASLRLAMNRIWESSSIVERRNVDHLQRYSYLVGFMQQAQISGLPVTPWQWRSVTYAVGLTGDWGLFHDLIVSITRMVEGKAYVIASDDSRKGSRWLNPTRELFDDKMQCFVLEVGLAATATKHLDPGEVWLRGMKLLRDVSQRSQIKLDYQSIIQTFKSRLKELFAGVDPGTQRRFASLYVRYLNWAWSEAGLSIPLKDSHGFYQRGVSYPDKSSLRLLQLHIRTIRRRKMSVERPWSNMIDQVQLDTSEPEVGNQQLLRRPWLQQATIKLQDERAQNQREQDGSTVFYADLLHPSYSSR